MDFSTCCEEAERSEFRKWRWWLRSLDNSSELLEEDGWDKLRLQGGGWREGERVMLYDFAGECWLRDSERGNSDGDEVVIFGWEKNNFNQAIHLGVLLVLEAIQNHW